MAPQPARSPKVCFGPFEFDPAASELSKYGARVRLQGQPILVLTMLLYEPGEVVTREELWRYLWPGVGLPEAESSLNRAIAALRQVLGDSEEFPQYIETLPGTGYRFVGKVHAIREGPPVIEVTATPAQPPPARKLPWRWIVLGAAACAAAAFGIWWWNRPPATGPAVELLVSAPDGFQLEYAAERQTMALSGDGARLAFTALNEAGTPHVFVKDLARAGAPRQMPGTAGAQIVFWSADGSSLFAAVKGKLHRVDPVANTFQPLADVPASVMSGAWLSPDRLLLSGGGTSLTVTLDGAPPRDLGHSFRWPQVLPDREHFLHSLFDPGRGRHQIRAALIDGVAGDGWDLALADSRGVVAADGQQAYLLFVREGNLMAQEYDSTAMRTAGDAVLVARDVLSSRDSGAAAFTASANGLLAYQKQVKRAQLVWVDRQGRQVGALGAADAMVKSGRISPDGSRIVASFYDVSRGEQDLWLIDAAGGWRKRVSGSPSTRDDAVWSRDGKRLAYSRGSAPRAPQTYLRDLSEDNESNADASAGGRPTRETPGDWSPDGRFLVVVSTDFPRLAAEQQSDIIAVDLLRDRRRRPLVRSRFDETLPAFSPDGRWLAFVSDESGEPEIYVQEFEGGDEPALLGLRQPVTKGGAQALRWRSDGKELFYLGLDGRVYAVPVTATAKALEFGAAAPLFRVSVEAQAAGPGRLGFDVSADGERFLVPKLAGGARPAVVVIRNWASRLGR